MTAAALPVQLEITGVGVVNAAGTTAKAYWEALAAGQPTARQVHLFGPDADAQWVMPVNDDQLDHSWSPRQVKRLDRMTMLSSAAIREALADARLETQAGESDRVGIFVGNATGGWGYVEPQLYPLYRDDDLGAINPYVATAWFPTATQGELSIAQGIGGTSKTFCAENLSTAFALRQAWWAIADGTLDVAVVCGVEAPLTPLVYNACVRTGMVSLDGAYNPYSFEGDGAPLGEGAAAIVLESAGRSRARQVRSRARLGAPALGPDRQAVIGRALSEAAICRVDYVALEGRGESEPDVLEMFAVESALEGDLPAMGSATGTSGAL
ncbi:MAG: hypothetical protein QOG10_7204, partial [Kribbellaceae bacterium]|nr:hypothetical protein [Kribbellaceae bacterium]